MLQEDGFAYSQAVNIILPKYEMDFIFSEVGKKKVKQQIRDLFWLIRDSRKEIDKEISAIR
jgi:hypothetical protein